MDRISNLPDHLISLILEKLPLFDAVKTGALSRSWRLRWTFLSSLNMNWSFCHSLQVSRPVEYASIMNSILLQYRGCIQNFDLFKPYNDDDDPSNLLFQHSIGYVMRCNTLERLILDATYEHSPFTLPPSVFSAVNLRYLEIGHFHIYPSSWFQGFPNLKGMVLESSCTDIDTISHFVKVCPLLEEVGLRGVEFRDFELDPFASRTLHLNAPKLKHLLVLDSSPCAVYVSVSNGQSLESIVMELYPLVPEYVDPSDEDEVEVVTADTFEFFNNSTQLQRVSFDGDILKCLGKCKVIHTLPRFGQMKSITFDGISLASDDLDMLQSLLSFCACSPNIRELKIRWWSCSDEVVDPLVLESMAEKYINFDFKHLARVELFNICGSGTRIEMKMIELLLRFSPVLEMMQVSLLEERGITNFYRASTKAKFNFVRRRPN